MVVDGVVLLDEFGKNREHVWVQITVIDLETKTWSKDVFYANDYFSLYDTYEIVSL